MTLFYVIRPAFHSLFDESSWILIECSNDGIEQNGHEIRENLQTIVPISQLVPAVHQTSMYTLFGITALGEDAACYDRLTSSC